MTSLDEFIDKWQLNEVSQKFLLDLPFQAQTDVMATFSPRDTSRDANGLFLSFVKSRKGERREKFVEPVPEERQPHHIDFFERWNLNELSQNALLRLPADVQADIIVKFQPRDTSRDCNGLFLSFIKGKGERRERFEPVPHPVPEERQPHHIDFFERWNLTETAQNMLLCLPSDIQADVMATFSPRDTSRDCNGLFLSFIKSKGDRREKFVEPVPEQKQPHHIDFFDRWNLNESSQDALLRLPPDVQADIIVKFQPRDTDPTRDCNGLFMSFIKSRAATMRITSGVSPLQTMSPRHLVPVSVPRFAAIPQPQISLVAVNQFINTWNLNEISENFLLSIPAHLQPDIMEKFSPRDTERDMNGVFLAYAKSRMGRDRATGGGLVAPMSQGGFQRQHVIMPQAAPPSPFISRNDLARKWNLNIQSLAIFDSLNTDVQNRVAREFAPRDTSRDANKCFIAFCRSRAAIQFVDRWALNEESCKLFSGLEPDIQQLMMTTFSPRDTSRDVNSVFQSYVRSRQNSANENGRGVKRQLDDVPAFVHKWQLRGENAAFLEGQDPEIAKEIMDKFNPRDTSRDCNAVFAKFAVALANKLQGVTEGQI